MHSLCKRTFLASRNHQVRCTSGHAYPPSVAGISQTVNFGHFSGEKATFTITQLIVVKFETYPAWKRAILNFCYNLKLDVYMTNWMQYRRMGFCFEDILAETPPVARALERLPDELMSERDDRIKEALVTGTRGDQLPKERWRKASEDKSYLSPYLADVMQELRDRQAFRPR